jgi:putative phosphoesterase
VIAIVADTHMPRGQRRLPARCIELCAGAELILHAGDFTGRSAYEEIAAIGPPLLAVAGNVDDAALAAELPAERIVEWRNRRIGMIHDAGPREGRLARMRRRFPDADAVIFGHSHLPLIERDPDGFQIVNPGSPTERRRAPLHTMALGRHGGGGLEVELVELARPD